MSELTNIAWCDSTWNPWVGCEKVSDGCKHCYAETLAQRFGRDFSKRSVSKDATFNAPLKWHKKPWVCKNDHATTGLGDAPLDGPHCDICGGEVHHRRRVFLGSMMDWLDPKISIDVFAKMLGIVRRCPELDFLCVTKRPELWYGRIHEAIHYAIDAHGLAATAAWLSFWKCGEQMLQNLWALASTENQEMAEKRIPELLKIPAVVRGLSIEPMIEPIDLTRDIPKIDWVIVGGESGKNARPCNVEWVRNIVRQCKSAGVPCFVKQLGTVCITDNANMDDWPENTRIIGQGIGCAAGRVMTVHSKGGDPVEWPKDLRVRQFPKAKK
jgi:protein gp37